MSDTPPGADAPAGPAPGAAAPAPADPARWRARHHVALVLVLLLALSHLTPFLGYLTDDTFIHLQFAKNLIAGEGFSFQAGKPTYGATSPGWVLLLAAAGTVTPGAARTPNDVDSMPSLAWIAKAWGALCIALSIALIVRIGITLGWSPWFALAPAALLGAHAWSARWGLSGMETPLATLLAILALRALARTLLRGSGAFASGLVLGLTTLARPECWLLVAIGVGAIATSADARWGRRTLTALAGVALGAGPWLMAAWVWFQRVVPNTSAAKAGVLFDVPLAVAAIRASIRILLATDALPIALSVIALAVGGHAIWRALPRERRAFWLLVAAWPILITLGYAAGGVQVVSRYLVPAVPALLLMGVASLRWATSRLRPRRATLLLAVFVALYAVPNLYLTLRLSAPHARSHTAGLRASLGAIGRWARSSTPAGTPFAMPDIGAFGYYSDRPVLDLFGLVTPVMAPITAREGYDAVVENLLFEKAGRPAYLLDRARLANRLADSAEPDNPYRFVMARSIPDLGITRPGAYVYSLYSIQWELYDRLHPRLARNGD